jgi:hypothetical protein
MPLWSRTRHEIIYGFEGQVMVAPYTAVGPRFSVGGLASVAEWTLSDTRAQSHVRSSHPDDEHLVLALDTSPPANGEPATASFVFNFFDDLKRLAAQ